MKELLYDLCHNRYDLIVLYDKLRYRVAVRTQYRNVRKAGPLFATPVCHTNAVVRFAAVSIDKKIITRILILLTFYLPALVFL